MGFCFISTPTVTETFLLILSLRLDAKTRLSHQRSSKK